jgi:hypothetical protein
MTVSNSTPVWYRARKGRKDQLDQLAVPMTSVYLAAMGGLLQLRFAIHRVPAGIK